MIQIREMTRVLMAVMLLLGAGRAQTDSTQQPADSAQQSNTAPAPAFGQNNPPAAVTENPPVTGLDVPALETNVAPRSFLLPGAQVSESLDSNIGSVAGNSAIHSVTRGLGSLELQRLWSRYELALDYVGGVAVYNVRGVGAQQIQSFDFEQKLAWRKGQFSVRDSFSYLPEGAFGYGAYGGVGAFQPGLSGVGVAIPGGGFGTFFGGQQFGSLAQEPRITNTSLAEIVESLSPRSTITAAGAYTIVHFTDNPLGLIDSRQVSGQAGYNYLLNSKDQIGLLYGYQGFHYPTIVGAGTLTAHLINAFYAHRISGRLDFVIGGGPQIIIRKQPLLSTNDRVAASGHASIRYRFPKTYVSLSYDHYDTAGSGFFAGAVTDAVRLSATRPLGRRWSGMADVGFARNRRIQSSFEGIPTGSYSYGYAGFALSRQLTRQLGAFLSYQFNEQEFGTCGRVTGPCNRLSQRHVAAIGLDWRPRPIRLD